MKNKVPNNIKNLQNLYNPDFDLSDLSLINELRHDKSKSKRNLCICVTIFGLLATGVTFTLCRDNVLSGKDVLAAACGVATTVSTIGIITNQSIINNKNGRTR